MVERGDTLTMHTLAPMDSAWGSVVISASRVGSASEANAAAERHAATLGTGSTIAQLVAGLAASVR